MPLPRPPKRFEDLFCAAAGVPAGVLLPAPAAPPKMLVDEPLDVGAAPNRPALGAAEEALLPNMFPGVEVGVVLFRASKEKVLPVLPAVEVGAACDPNRLPPVFPAEVAGFCWPNKLPLLPPAVLLPNRLLPVLPKREGAVAPELAGADVAAG